jgi:hypothetical protein
VVIDVNINTLKTKEMIQKIPSQDEKTYVWYHTR